MSLYSGVESTASGVSVFKDMAFCAQLLKSVKASKPLGIYPSRIPDEQAAGYGLYTEKDVDNGEEIFRSEALLNSVEDGMESCVCDYCYLRSEATVKPGDCLRTPEDAISTLRACLTL
jgi:hypothetical protein